MTAKQLDAVRRFFARKPEGDYEFISDCLKGVRGESAKWAAESVLVGAIDAGYGEDDPRMAGEIVAMVQNEEDTEKGDTAAAAQVEAAAR